jgi:periplasmic protein TonB
VTSPRRTLRPPVGIPSRARQRSWQGTVASLLVHAAIGALLLSPGAHAEFRGTPAVGGGGAGAAGGGGGGGGGARRAAGERLQFLTIPRPQPAAAEAVAKPDVSEVRTPMTPAPAPPPLPVTPAGAVASGSAGEGSGTGAGGAGEGAGPGSGGGVGSGIGTGRGSGGGPGTGGGPGDIYPPTPTQFFLPPLPAPDRIRPYHLIAWFDVDERGNATLLHFNPSRDAGYNRRLRDVLLTLRFRPAVRADGTPVRDTVDIHYIF